MKILSVNGIKTGLKVATVATGTLVLSSFALKAQKQHKHKDSFTLVETVTPAGNNCSTVLDKAPSSEIVVAGKKHNAAIVVDLSTNILYHYDEKGNAVNAFLVASGKKEKPTDRGIRRVTHTEIYPYKNAPAHTKRKKQPNLFGSRIIFLDKVDPDTGVSSAFDEFIHGNSNPASLGKYASNGCIRMDNKAIKNLAKVIKQGHYVLIK